MKMAKITQAAHDKRVALIEKQAKELAKMVDKAEKIKTAIVANMKELEKQVRAAAARKGEEKMTQVLKKIRNKK